MKTSRILILAILLAIKSFGQDYPTPFVIEKIDSAKGTKDELFVKANVWVAKTFVNAKDVIQMHDKEAGKIVVKGLINTKNFSFVIEYNYYSSFLMTIDVKDNKYRYSFSDFIFTEWVNSSHSDIYNQSFESGRPKGLSGIPQKVWDKIQKNCWTQAKLMGRDLESAMKAKSDNW